MPSEPGMAFSVARRGGGLQVDAFTAERYRPYQITRWFVYNCLHCRPAVLDGPGKYELMVSRVDALGSYLLPHNACSVADIQPGLLPASIAGQHLCPLILPGWLMLCMSSAENWKYDLNINSAAQKLY
jgi:hypothetical protein